MAGIQRFAIQILQLSCVFEIFHSKLLKKGYAEGCNKDIKSKRRKAMVKQVQMENAAGLGSRTNPKCQLYYEEINKTENKYIE